MLTPDAVQLGPKTDKELVIVVCLDDEGEAHNHYIRDAALQAELKTAYAEHDRAATAQRDSVEASIAAAKAAIDAPVLARATKEIGA